MYQRHFLAGCEPCHCCSRKRRQLTFLRVGGGGLQSTGPRRSSLLKACNRTSLEALMQHCSDVPPASINPPHLSRLLACHSVTKNTWKFSGKDCSNLEGQQCLSIFLFQNKGTVSHRMRFHFNLSICLFYMYFSPETPLLVSATMLEPCDIWLFLFERNPFTQSTAVNLLHIRTYS